MSYQPEASARANDLPLLALRADEEEAIVDPEVLLLSRIQFAMTIMFHYIFPPLSIGLGVLMVLMEALYLRSGNIVYHRMTRFWTKIFAVNFAMGVATGIVMEFQFGTNWARYARYVGDVFGSALAAEGIFAFFLESGFLAVLVFGWDRVSKGMHFFATLMVSLGSIFSAIWIIVANSWQHTPVGFQVVDNQAIITDFWAVLFNPSSMNHLIHALLGAFILGAFFVMSIASWYLLHGRHIEFARKSLTLGLIFGCASSLAMGLSGHFNACMVAKYQPAKLAALEGHFKTGKADLHLFGVPDAESGEVKYGAGIPGGLSFLVHEDFNAPIAGLDQFRPEDKPPVTIPFISYHLMVGLGGSFIGLTLLGLFFLWRGTLFEKRWLLWVYVVAIFGPYIANQAGWVATEVGRQPFVVYPAGINADDLHRDADGLVKMEGGLRTIEGMSNSKVVGKQQIIGSIVMFAVMYALLFVVWVYVLHSKIQHGPDEEEAPPPPETSREGLIETVGTPRRELPHEVEAGR